MSTPPESDLHDRVAVFRHGLISRRLPDLSDEQRRVEMRRITDGDHTILTGSCDRLAGEDRGIALKATVRLVQQLGRDRQIPGGGDRIDVTEERGLALAESGA